MKKIAVIVLCIATIIIVIVFLSQKTEKGNQSAQQNRQTTVNPSGIVPTKNQNVNYRAAFAIFTHGTFRIFNDPKYHNQSEDVFVQASTPNIITIKRQGVTWQDFFNTLPMSLNKECLITGTGQSFCSSQGGNLKFYINGNENPEALVKEITHGDRLLVTFGNENEEVRKQQLQQMPTF